MTNIKTFDVLVVYTEAIATSASSKERNEPFWMSGTRSHYNNAYSYLLETCRKNNLSAAFSTSKDITESGTVSCYWTFEHSKWTKINKPAYSKLIFDKVSPIGTRLKEIISLLFSDSNVLPFNSPGLFSLFFDKNKTFDELSDYAIPTVIVENSNLEEIKKLSRQ